MGVRGRLIYVRLEKNGKWIDVWLFTTLLGEEYSVELLMSWYGQRWQAELHFSSVKTKMKMATLNVGSPEMARKEFYSGLLAYSLVRMVMWQGSVTSGGRVQDISFSQARRVLLEYLQAWGRQFGRSSGSPLLVEIAGHTLPKRRKKRPNEIRCVRYKRQKYPPLRGSRADARAKMQTIKSL